MPPKTIDKVSAAITESFAAMGQRRQVWDGVERAYLNEKDATFKGAFVDSTQYPLPMLYVIVDTLASMMMGAFQSADPKWVVKFSNLPVDIVKALEMDVQLTFESMPDNMQALDDAIHSTLLLGSAALELEHYTDADIVPAPIDARLKPEDIALILSPAAERLDDTQARVVRSAGVRVLFHDARNVFVYPVEVRNPQREATVYGVRRYYSEHEVPASWWNASDAEPDGDAMHNPRLGAHVQPRSFSTQRKPFYKGICRLKSGAAYEFVMPSRRDKFLRWERVQNVLPVSPYVFLRAIPVHGRWYGKGVGEMLAPLSNANSALMSMLMDAVRLSVSPPIGLDPASHAQVGGEPIRPGDTVAVEDAQSLIVAPDMGKILTAMQVLRTFMDLIAGTGSASYGVEAPQGTATAAGIADRASRMRGNKLFDRIRMPLADVPLHISEYLLRNWKDAIRLLPLRAHPIAFASPVKWEVNAVSLFSTAEHRQAMLMAILDRMLQAIPAVLPDPAIMLDIIRNMATVMEVPNVASFMREIEERLGEQAASVGGVAEPPADEGAVGGDSTPGTRAITAGDSGGI